MKKLIFRGQPIRNATGGMTVTVQMELPDGNALELPLPPRNDLVNHSPDGFGWGYGGSGAAQLAFAILSCVCCDRCALQHYQQFKWDVIAALPPDEQWILRSEDIEEYAKGKGIVVPSKP